MFSINTKTRRAFALAGLTLVVTAVCQAQGYVFFSRASDLSADSVWAVNEFGEGPNILDLHVRRWNGSRWTRLVPGGNEAVNSGWLTYGTPVYAPADGVIKTCWNGFPDNPVPGQKLTTVVGAEPRDALKLIFQAGNHVNIETPDGKIILLAHLKQGSIPPSLCPYNSPIADVTKPSGYGYPAVSIIPEGQRPQIKRGQLIGQAGNSGNSSAPHVHIHMAPRTSDVSNGTAEPVPFIQGWRQALTSNAPTEYWYRLANTAITSTSGPTIIHPSPLLRRATQAESLPVEETDVTILGGNRAVAAVRDNLGQLRLRSYQFDGTDSMIPRAEVIEGLATKMKIVAWDYSHAVVALRDSTGNLKLILYQVGPTGSLTRLDDLVVDPVHSLDMTVTSGTGRKIMVAMRRQSDNKLRILAFQVNTPTGASATLQSVTSRLEQGTVSALAITSASNFSGAVVAVRTAENKLKLIPYRLTSGGSVIERGSDFEGGYPAAELDVAAIPKGVVAAFRDSLGRLRLCSAEFTAGGNYAGNHEFYITTDVISQVSILRTQSAAGGNVVTAVRDAGGDLRLDSWTMLDGGDNIQRSSSSAAGSVSRFALATRVFYGAGVTARDMVLTAMRDAANNLRLIEWEANLNP